MSAARIHYPESGLKSGSAPDIQIIYVAHLQRNLLHARLSPHNTIKNEVIVLESLVADYSGTRRSTT